MGESRHQATTSSRLALRSGGGEIVEVQGGHIVRSTGRKDRHSKVCTAKGPRDRRVRLSAHTAIQFYDVQDRLGYDRPSKAVDWLIKKAKAAIDELEELPAWDPLATNASSEQEQQPQQRQQQQQEQPQMNLETDSPIGVRHRPSMDTTGSANRRAATRLVGGDVRNIADCSMRNLPQHLDESPNNNSSSFLPPSLESDSIVDTIKSFFPMGAAAETPSSTIQYQTYPPDLLSRTSSHSQDLRLSLQSLQDPVLLHHHHQAQHQAQSHNRSEHVFFSGANQLGFDASSTGWSEQPQPIELGRFQRLVAWHSGAADTGTSGHGGTGVGGGAGAFHFNSPPTQTQLPPSLQPFFGQSQFLSQRGPLQSSNTPLIRAWIDPSVTAVTATVTDHHYQNQHHEHLPQNIHQSSFSGLGFTSGGFSGFRIPARIQGEEEHDGISEKPSSASSDSRH